MSIGVVDAWHAEGNSADPSHNISQTLLIYAVGSERRIDEGVAPRGGVIIAVYLAAVANVAFQSMPGEAQASEAAGLIAFPRAIVETRRRPFCRVVGPSLISNLRLMESPDLQFWKRIGTTNWARW